MADSFDKAKKCMKIGCWSEILALVISGYLASKTADMSFGETYDYYNNSSSYGFGILLGFIGIILLIIGAIWWTKAAASATVDAVAEIIEFTINKVVDAFSVKEEVIKRCPHALKIKILEKEKNAVNVGIFNTPSEMSQKMSIKSEQGVSNSIQVGQEIYLNN